MYYNVHHTDKQTAETIITAIYGLANSDVNTESKLRG